MVDSKNSLHADGSNPMFKVEPKDTCNTKISDLLGNRFIAKRGLTEREKEETTLTEETTADQFEDANFVGLFFAAGWCPPCKSMMKSLKNFYTDANNEERTIEVVLVSSDRSQEEWQQHHASMPWLSLEYGDPTNDKLRAKYDVRAVPRLVILDSKTGFTITEKGRKDLSDDVAGVYKTWDKLYDLKKVWAVEAAESEATATSQKLERDFLNKKKKEEDAAKAALGEDGSLKPVLE